MNMFKPTSAKTPAEYIDLKVLAKILKECEKYPMRKSYFIVLSFIAYTLWTLHGMLQKDAVLAVGQGIGIITTGIILYQIWLYRKK